MEREPDVIALQEVRAGAVAEWEDAVASGGLRHFLSTRELVEDRHNFVAVASRYELAPAEACIEVPMPELVLALHIATPKPVELIATHVPNGSGYKWKKVEHFEALYRYLVLRGERPRILCGDFNAPRRELPDGRTFTWAQTEDGTLRANRGHRWDAAERSVLLGLEPFGLVDVYRSLGNEVGAEGSWVPRGTERHRRFDHVFADPSLNPKRCGYIHAWRTETPTLSDHSAIEVDFG